jgi:hypothetical protein
MTNAVKFDSKFKIDKLITRFEFLEILVRMAKARFFEESHEADSISEGLEFLFREIFSNYRDEPWDNFRVHKLWKLEINDIFMNNLDKCKILMN